MRKDSIIYKTYKTNNHISITIKDSSVVSVLTPTSYTYDYRYESWVFLFLIAMAILAYFFKKPADISGTQPPTIIKVPSYEGGNFQPLFKYEDKTTYYPNVESTHAIKTNMDYINNNKITETNL